MRMVMAVMHRFRFFFPRSCFISFSLHSMELLGIFAEHFHLISGRDLNGAALELSGSIAHVFFQEAFQLSSAVLPASLLHLRVLQGVKR